MLDAVIVDPRRFLDVGFALTTGNATVPQLDGAKAVVQKNNQLSDEEINEVNEWSLNNAFAEWPLEDVYRWPSRFINIHKGPRKNRLHYTFYERAHIADFVTDVGSVLARRTGNLRRPLGFNESARNMADVDYANATYIFDHIDGYKFFANGEEVARFLVTLEPWS